jgi:heavy metal efflux system protein
MLVTVRLATGVGTDSQRLFALVIIGGLFSRWHVSVLLMPMLHGLVARGGDHLEI